jgi:hypothetical protein
MRSFAPALILALAGVLAAADCGGGGDGPTETPTLTTLSADIFQPRCGNAACHGGSNPAAGLDLVTDPYAALVGVDSISDPALKRVAAGDPNNSVLLLILEGPVGASRQMPPGVTLPAEDVDAIRAWITAGAAND